MINQNNLENKLEIFDTIKQRDEIDIANIFFENRYNMNNKSTALVLIGASVMETIAATSMMISGYEELGKGIAIAGAATIAYGVKSLLTKESKLAHIITKNQLGYEPKQFEKDTLKIVSEQ